MPSITLSISYRRFTSDYESLLISPKELLESYFVGIDTKSEKTSRIQYDFIRQKIVAAQQELENSCSIKIWEQVFMEQKDFSFDEWKRWAFVSLSFPVKAVYEIAGYIGGVNQISFPVEWSSIHKSSDERSFFKTLHLVPTGRPAQITMNNIVGVGMVPFASFMGYRNVPNYWSVKYLTGFRRVPSEISDTVGKMAAIPILNTLSNILMPPGIASKHVSYDGLSESVQTTRAGNFGLFGSTMVQYEREVKATIERLRDFYGGIVHTVI